MCDSLLEEQTFIKDKSGFPFLESRLKL